MFVRRLISSLSIHRLETPKDIFKWTHSTFTFPLYSTSVLPSPLISVTRLLDYFSTFGCLHQLKFAQKYTKFAKVGSKFCQIVNKPLKIAQDFQLRQLVRNLASTVSNFSANYRHLTNDPSWV